MIEKIKTHWKEILIGILVLFSLSKCTQSCSRQTKVDKLTKELAISDSTIKSLEADTLNKKHTVDMLNEKLNTSAAQTDAANARTEVIKANGEAAAAKAKAIQLQKRLQNKR